AAGGAGGRVHAAAGGRLAAAGLKPRAGPGPSLLFMIVKDLVPLRVPDPSRSWAGRWEAGRGRLGRWLQPWAPCVDGGAAAVSVRGGGGGGRGGGGGVGRAVGGGGGGQGGPISVARVSVRLDMVAAAPSCRASATIRTALVASRTAERPLWRLVQRRACARRA